MRAAVIASTSILLWQSLHKPAATVNTDVDATLTPGTLSRLTTGVLGVSHIHLRLDSVPGILERDWLRALNATGSRVSWSGDIPAVMIAVEPVASPEGGTKVRIAAPTGSIVEVRDEAGVVDSVHAQAGGASLLLSSPAGELTARVDRSTARVIPRDSVRLQKVLVIGEAGWESKFVIAALEEAGWNVDAFVRVAPGVDVTQGSPAMIDTSRYSAVIALDAAASPYAHRIIEFVRSGGGVVLSPQAASRDEMAFLRAGAVGRALSEAPAIQASRTVSLVTLALVPITSLRSDAVPLDKSGATVAIAARRIEAGRALQIGYEDTWRWRMAGGEGAVRDHRAWWTGLVSSVAYAPRLPRPGAAPRADEAPLAQLVDAIGPATTAAAIASIVRNRSHWTAWLFLLLSLGLIGEVASRRLRGAR